MGALFSKWRAASKRFWAISDTFLTGVLPEIDYRRKIAGTKMLFVGRPPLSRLRRRFEPLRGAPRRCAALRAAPPGRCAPRALRAHHFSQHEKNAGFLVKLLPEYTGGPRAPLLSVLETFESYSLRTRAQGAAPPRGPCRTHMRPLLAPVVISSRSECVLCLRGQRRVSLCGFKS